jgi:glutamine synthetase
VSGNGYAQAAERVLPATWQEALERAGRAGFLARALGPETARMFLAVKGQECRKFAAQVTELDYAWYLRSC